MKQRRYANCCVIRGRGIAEKSLHAPTAVLPDPVVLLKSANAPLAVFSLASGVAERCRTGGRILICGVEEKRPGANSRVQVARHVET